MRLEEGTYSAKSHWGRRRREREGSNCSCIDSGGASCNAQRDLNGKKKGKKHETLKRKVWYDRWADISATPSIGSSDFS